VLNEKRLRACVKRIVKPLFLALSLIALPVAPAFSWEVCEKAGLFQSAEGKNSLLVTRVGMLWFSVSDDPTAEQLPAFALEMILPNGDNAYAYGQLASYTFLTNYGFLLDQGVEWREPTRFSGNEFYRFVEDDGKTPYFEVRFVSCVSRNPSVVSNPPPSTCAPPDICESE